MAPQEKALKVGIARLTHTHVHWLLGRPDRGDIEIVGIAEPNRELAMRYLKQHGLDEKLWYATMEEMIEKSQPEAVCAFGSIYEHLEVLSYCAPRGIHVMVEKPLAVNYEHAKKMQELAQAHKIHLLTNYETTWYPAHYQAHDMIFKKEAIGEIRKVVIHDGHPGPIEIGCNPEFLEWLTDPEMNGAGALTDFGCYGANLMTWLMQGERPSHVTAITQQIKPELYPKVEDEATIILTYPKAQAIIQASWNWPISRKDMEIYGKTGQILIPSRDTIYYQANEESPEQILASPPLPTHQEDPFAYLAGVVRAKIDPAQGLSSLAINMIVMEILEAAILSAQSGQTIQLKK